MRKVLLLSAVSIASLGLTLSAAQAADFIPEAAPVANFTGFHIGIGGGAGYNFYDAESDALLSGVIEDEGEDGDLIVPLLGDVISGDDLGAWYGFGTIEAGFDYQFEDSPFVVGILGSYDFNGNSEADAEHSTFIIDPAAIALNSRIAAELDDAWFLGGRLGFVFNDDTLVYGLGGYTWVKGKVKADHQLDIGGAEFEGTHADEEESVDGWTIGAGIEHLITANLSLKIEYRHDFLDDIEFDELEVFDGDGEPFDQFTLEQDGKVDFSRDTIRAVLSWRFNPFE